MLWLLCICILTYSRVMFAIPLVYTSYMLRRHRKILYTPVVTQSVWIICTHCMNNLRIVHPSLSIEFVATLPWWEGALLFTCGPHVIPPMSCLKVHVPRCPTLGIFRASISLCSRSLLGTTLCCNVEVKCFATAEADTHSLEKDIESTSTRDRYIVSQITNWPQLLLPFTISRHFGNRQVTKVKQERLDTKWR